MKNLKNKDCSCCGQQSETYDDWRPITHQIWCGCCGFDEESISGFMTLEKLGDFFDKLPKLQTEVVRRI